jgi:hypothetical protein
MAEKSEPETAHTMLFITRQPVRPDGYVNLSDSSSWTKWLYRNVPERIHRTITRRLVSNLKHLLVGLELKAALIGQHHYRADGERSVLFEPYFQNLILEFCVASFSVFEGLGSAQWLDQNGQDGADGPKINRREWLPALGAVYDETDEHRLVLNVENTLAVRDRLHQDKLGTRDDIDWHAFSYDAAFAPASAAIRTLLQREADLVPATSNLHREPGA